MSTDKLKVLIKAPYEDYSGYATVARNLILELYKSDVFDLYLEPIVWINSGNLNLPAEDLKILHELREKKYKPGDTTLVHFSIATEFFGENSIFKKTVGFTMMETDRTANGWAFKCNQMDAILVPSTFCLSSFMQSGISKPLRVVPFGLDFDKYVPEGEALLKDLPTKFNFLTVGQWQPQGDRKNIMGVLHTFFNLFKDNSDVGLILKTYITGAGVIDLYQVESYIGQLREQYGFKEGEGPQVYLVHGALDDESMIKLYRNADVFVLPTHGEAWGMPLFEAAAMELPIITTGGSGAESFLNPEFVAFLEYEWKPLENLMFWQHVYEPYQQVTMPNMEQFSRLMNKFYTSSYDTLKARAVKQREELISRKFTWKNAAEIFVKTIIQINQ